MPSHAFAHRSARRWIAEIAAASILATTGHAFAQTEQEALVNASETTFANFMRDPDMTWLQRHIGRAKAVLIAPSVVKAGWILGGSGGRAVLFARDDQTGRWRGPAFYNVGAASVGFQAGIAVSETVALVMTAKGMNSLLATSVKLGGDASVAAGPIGAGANSDLTADFVAFSRAKGRLRRPQSRGQRDRRRRQLEPDVLRHGRAAAGHPVACHRAQRARRPARGRGEPRGFRREDELASLGHAWCANGTVRRRSRRRTAARPACVGRWRVRCTWCPSLLAMGERHGETRTRADHRRRGVLADLPCALDRRDSAQTTRRRSAETRNSPLGGRGREHRDPRHGPMGATPVGLRR